MRNAINSTPSPWMTLSPTFGTRLDVIGMFLNKGNIKEHGRYVAPSVFVAVDPMPLEPLPA